MDKKNQIILVGAAVITVAAIIAFGSTVVVKLERVVQVAERSEQKLDRIIEAASPLGQAALEKGVSVMQSVDEQELAESTQDGLQELGAAAKHKLLEWIESQSASPTNREIPNLQITVEGSGRE